MTFAELKAKVEQDADVTNAVVTLIGGIVEKLRAAIASGNPAETEEVIDEIDARKDDLGAATVRNTPAEE